MVGFVTKLVCCQCGSEYKPEDVPYTCPKCGEEGLLEVQYDYAAIKEDIQKNGFSTEKGMWRYRQFLPIDREAEAPGVLVGQTPLYCADRVAKKYGLGKVYIKDDGRNPTASLKDRASSLLAAKGKHEKRGILTTASTGNAGAAMAAMCACLEHPCVIFVPKSAPIAKITQLLVYGASVILVDGTYDDACVMCAEATKKYGWYCRTTGFNPYTCEGKKTVSFEFCEQLAALNGKSEGCFEVPDWVAVSIGDGNIIKGIHRGLEDLYGAGLISKIPKLLGCQAEGSAVVYETFHSGSEEIVPNPSTTLADSIAAGKPQDGLRAVRAVRASGGTVVKVTDEEIVRAIPELARLTGVFAEPAASCTYAGLQTAVKSGVVGPSDSVLLVITGNGLKDVATAQKSVAAAPVVPKGDLDALKTTLKEVYGL
eukprot:GCRY01004587.1.p1 GENE.GCRY01004587.1~~GCRY01004587.1.p1  ORF type:complete len:425 (-),score=106.81 GCRY01004587.1:34-1308(-)